MKFCLIMGIVFGMYLPTVAQVGFGIKTGLNLSTLRYSGITTLSNQKSLLGFQIGVLTSITMSHYFSLQPELVYSMQGTIYQVGNTQASYHYNYLNVPLLMKYQHPIGVFAVTGLQIGFLLNARNTIQGQSTDVKAKMYSPDYAWIFGLGYQFQNTPWAADIRYNLGLINIQHQDTGDLNVYNAVIQFGLFYHF